MLEIIRDARCPHRAAIRPLKDAILHRVACAAGRPIHHGVVDIAAKYAVMRVQAIAARDDADVRRRHFFRNCRKNRRRRGFAQARRRIIGFQEMLFC